MGEIIARFGAKSHQTLAETFTEKANFTLVNIDQCAFLRIDYLVLKTRFILPDCSKNIPEKH